MMSLGWYSRPAAQKTDDTLERRRGTEGPIFSESRSYDNRQSGAAAAAMGQLASNKVLLFYDPYKLVQGIIIIEVQKRTRETVQKTCHLCCCCC